MVDTRCTRVKCTRYFEFFDLTRTPGHFIIRYIGPPLHYENQIFLNQSLIHENTTAVECAPRSDAKPPLAI